VEDGRRSYDDIARRVSLSAPAVKRRIDRLRADGSIRGFSAVIDPEAFGWRTEALVELFYAPGATRRSSRPGASRATPTPSPACARPTTPTSSG
jgi:DNA-binding Lrp family transcriptional regulator